MGRVYQLLARFAVLIWIVAPTFVRGQSINNIFNLPGSATAQPLSSGRVFFAATNGNDGNAKINDSTHPWNGNNLSTNSGVLSLATNYGDTITMLPGNYNSLTNITLQSGVTFQGIGIVIVAQNTNAPVINGQLVNNSLFQPQGNNIIIRNITWVGTNGWNPVANAGTFESMIGSPGFGAGGAAYQNVQFDNCRIFAGSDVFYGGGAISNSIVIRNCYIHSFWDFASWGGEGNNIISYNNIWDGCNASRINFTAPAQLIDFGSAFNNFSGVQGPPQAVIFFSGTPSLHGSTFNFSAARTAPIFGTTGGIIGNGEYVVNTTNVQSAFTLNPVHDYYGTNGFMTNTANNFNTNVIIIASATVNAANVNGTYTLSGFITNPPISTASTTITTGTWTNNANAAITLTMNDPANPAFPPPAGQFAIGILGTGGGYSDYADTVAFGNFLNGSIGPAPQSFGATAGTATYAFATNSTTTNISPISVPAIFSGRIWFDNTNLIQSIAGLTWTFNGGSLTNIGAIQTTGTNTLSITAGGGLTNNSAFNYILSITAGTAMTLKDGNGNGILNPVANESIPFKPGWRLAGTAASVTAQAIQQ